MNDEQFRYACSVLCEFIIKYKNVDMHADVCKFEPGIVSHQLSDFSFTDSPKQFSELYEKIISVIIPNTVNWQHPLFFGYFPSCNSYPSILGEMLSAGIGAIGLSWKSCPSLTELEFLCVHDLIYTMRLPFVSGNILSSSSEAILISMIISINMKKDKDRSKFVIYASNIAHSSVFKAASILNLNVRSIDILDFNWTMNIDKLRTQIVNDINDGYIPIYILGTFGTTSVCSYDNLARIGEIAKEYNLYFHVDAAYAGSSLFLRKYRRMARGLECANSININCNKLMLVNYDCTLALYKDVTCVVDALSIDPPYLHSEYNRIDLRNYDVSLSRRFRSLKLWLTIHTYGLRGIRRHIRRQFRLARYLARLIIENDTRLEIINEIRFGLVCFRVRDSNNMTELLAESLAVNTKIFFISSCINGIFFIRLSINNIHNRNELKYTVNEISKSLDRVMGVRDHVNRTQSAHGKSTTNVKCNIVPIPNIIFAKKINNSESNKIGLGCIKSKSIVANLCGTTVFRDVDNNIKKILDGKNRSVSCQLNVNQMKKMLFSVNDSLI